MPPKAHVIVICLKLILLETSWLGRDKLEGTTQEPSKLGPLLLGGIIFKQQATYCSEPAICTLLPAPDPKPKTSFKFDVRFYDKLGYPSTSKTSVGSI